MPGQSLPHPRAFATEVTRTGPATYRFLRLYASGRQANRAVRPLRGGLPCGFARHWHPAGRAMPHSCQPRLARRIRRLQALVSQILRYIVCLSSCISSRILLGVRVTVSVDRGELEKARAPPEQMARHNAEQDSLVTRALAGLQARCCMRRPQAESVATLAASRAELRCCCRHSHGGPHHINPRAPRDRTAWPRPAAA